MTYEKMYEQWLSNLNKEIHKRKLKLEKLADLNNMEKVNICCILTGTRKTSAKTLFSIASSASILPRNIPRWSGFSWSGCTVIPTQERTDL